MNKSSVFNAQKSTYFQILYCVLESILEYRTWTELMVKQWTSSGNIFPGFTTLQLSQEVQELRLRLGERPEKFPGRIIFMSLFNDISWGSKDDRKNARQMLNLFLSMQKDSAQDNGHSSVLVQRKSGLLSVKIVHKVNGAKWRKR